MIAVVYAEWGVMTGGFVPTSKALSKNVLSIYDASGQLLCSTFMDYAMPTAARVPSVELSVHEAPARSNPLGVKGAGESGTSGVGAAVANAVAAAVGDAAARQLPVTATRVKAALA